MMQNSSVVFARSRSQRRNNLPFEEEEIASQKRFAMTTALSVVARIVSQQRSNLALEEGEIASQKDVRNINANHGVLLRFQLVLNSRGDLS